MKKFLLIGLLSVQCVFAQQPLEEYLSYLEQLNQSTGDHRQGEIEVVTDPAEISQIQKCGKSTSKKRIFRRAGFGI